MLTAKDLEKYHQAAERILNAMDNSPVPISWHEMDRMALQETGSIRFTFYKFFTGEVHDHLSVTGRRNEAVMFFCGEVCHWLEPVSIMGSSMIKCPFFHGNCNRVGNIKFEMCTVLNCFFQCLVHVFR